MTRIDEAPAPPLVPEFSIEDWGALTRSPAFNAEQHRTLSQQTLDRAARGIARDFDRAVSAALDAHLGAGQWTLEGLRGHLFKTRPFSEDRSRHEEFEVLYFDDVPLLRVWDPTFPPIRPWNCITYMVSQRFQYLIPGVEAPAA